MSTTFHPVLPADQVAEGTAREAIVNGWPVLLARSGGALFATINRCTHAASSLAGGRVRGGNVMCPLHGARFTLATGACIGGAYKPLMTFELRETAAGIVEVAVPDAEPGVEHLPVRD